MAKITYDATTRMVSLHLDTHVVQVTATTFRQLFANGLMDVVRQLMGDNLPPVQGMTRDISVHDSSLHRIKPETLPPLSEPYVGDTKPVPKDGEYWNTVIIDRSGRRDPGVARVHHITKDAVYLYPYGNGIDGDLVQRYLIDDVEFVSRAPSNKIAPAATKPGPGEWWHVRIAVGESVYRAYVDRISDTGDIVHMKVGASPHVLAYDYKSVEFICPINDGVKPLVGQWWQVIIKYGQEAKMRIDRLGMTVTLEDSAGRVAAHPHSAVSFLRKSDVQAWETT